MVTDPQTSLTHVDLESAVSAVLSCDNKSPLGSPKTLLFLQPTKKSLLSSTVRTLEAWRAKNEQLELRTEK